MTKESAKLLGFVLKHQETFAAIKMAGDDPTDGNIEDMQRSIYFLVKRERADARASIYIAAIISVPFLFAGLKYFLC